MKNKIRRLVEYYISKYDTNDPFEIAGCLDIHISVCPLGNISGIYKYLERSKWIFINSEIEDHNFRKVVMAHELGHAVLHWKENCTFMSHKTLLLTSKIESQANLFAARLLISDQVLENYKEYTIDQFCHGTGYPIELIELRLK